MTVGLPRDRAIAAVIRQAFPTDDEIRPKKTRDEIGMIPMDASWMGEERDELFHLAIKAYAAHSTQAFKGLQDIERLPLRLIRGFPTKGTVLEPIIAAWRRAGLPTEPTVGFVLDRLRINKRQLHRLACECVDGGDILGCQAERRLRRIAKEPPHEPYWNAERIGILAGVATVLGVFMYLAS